MIAVVTVIAPVLAVAVATVAILLTVGARREPAWLPVKPPGQLARLARRILGLHVRRPFADVPELRREPTGAAERR